MAKEMQACSPGRTGLPRKWAAILTAVAGCSVAIRRVTPEIGAGGLAAYREHASEEVLGARWRELIEALL